MMNEHDRLNDSFAIFLGELTNDAELRGSFLRDPRQTLDLADEWALPLTDSELQALRSAPYAVWERVAEELSAARPESSQVLEMWGFRV